MTEANESLPEVKTWTEKIFAQNAEDFQLPTEVWKWFSEVTLDAYAKAENNLIRNRF